MMYRKFAALLFALLFIAGCAPAAQETPDAGENTDTGAATSGITVKITGDVPLGEYICSITELSEDEENAFSCAYSLINNWPTKKFAAASGVTIEAVLKAAGVWDTFEVITVKADDGYAMSFTREQVEKPRYYYPNLEKDDPAGNKLAPMGIALQYCDDGADLDAMTECSPTFVFGQEDIYEHNSPAFVEQMVEIEVSDEEPEQWEMAYGFPEPGVIAAGETVKLQHGYMGLAKLFYTTDGSDPTTKSAMYNPSTYQPELSVPIEITEDTVIKVLVHGYGRTDSEIAELVYTVAE